MSHGTSRARRLSGPAELLIALGAVAQTGGASLAVLLFAEVSPPGAAWLRMLGAAAVLGVWLRPWRRTWTWHQLRLVTAFGVALGGMNLAFYLSIDRLPLGTAVAIEFIGPMTVAAAGARTRRDLAALLLALTGVGLLADVHLGASPAGVALALTAAGLWAAYIVLGHRVVADPEVRPRDALAAAMLVAAIAFAPALAPSAAPVIATPWLLALCVALGLAASVVPYLLDQVAMARVSRARFALLTSLLPAAAALTGLVVLRQIPTLTETAGIVLVVGASTLQSHRAERRGDA
ncbi:MAG: protein of unknown function transrane [Conexibacter sp.]|jgi:inner membrane transporter RhtA|nr:protein of unknown function transrane [Conexibacter sp.]